LITGTNIKELETIGGVLLILGSVALILSILRKNKEN
jgi:hypothetical protein